ncbi:hypothetical protein SAVCW2_27340 [Streptomyces avermitilis]|nr:hypothetical protein SAVCW2_27340 [Streptomyces avermitilis]
MAGGLHVVQRPLDLALLVHDHRGADDADDRLAVQLLLAEGAVRLQDLLVRVADQRDLQVLLLAELRELLGLVGGDADDVVTGARQQLQVVREVAGLLGAAGGQGGRVEVDDDLAALVVGQGDLVAVGVRQGEGGAVSPGWSRSLIGTSRGKGRVTRTSLMAPADMAATAPDGGCRGVRSARS